MLRLLYFSFAQNLDRLHLLMIQETDLESWHLQKYLH